MLFKNLLIFFLVVVSSFFANLFIFKTLKSKTLTSIQPIRSFEPIITIILSILFSFFIDKYRFNAKLIIPSIIASIALIFPYIKKEKIKLSKYLLFAFFGSFLFALELILSNLILNLYSPLTFYFLRCFFVFIISFFIFKPDFKKLNKKDNILLFITGFAWTVYRFVLYISYKNQGVIFTTTIMLLAPILTYVLASLFLKEKLNWKNILSSLIIILCIIYSILFI